MDKAKKAELIKEFAVKEGDVGSSQVQIAILTERIKGLTAHMSANPKDKHTMRGLIRMVNRRRKLLRYLNSESHDEYTKIIKKLGLRK
ncbi:MAG: 30S ribosomal protein S15 [Lentisphaeria bacterium]|nr:30S ribosomal protein S15 [Lentisphaeria bacterium]